ncbi:MAG: bifunctional diaminohydroxyphosphoribosylaminopyrimidine deaminase/5-amino-6-(5-phosphoribosylamino)uracil reductase RibD, partial [Rhizomicrobium sp.]
APNPSVGCVIVAGGRIVGRGWTQPGGRPHAETQALAAAGAAAKGATAYVTLEPCAHYGQTPPCAQALIDGGVARVVAAATDPDPRVAGKGFAMLRAARIAVTEGVCQSEALALNQGFFLTKTASRPLVTLKLATSLDGKIASAGGESKWITGPAARRYGHLLRARHDAILVGIGTALADDPELSCRLPGMVDRTPIRVVLDSDLRLPAWSKLVKTARRWPLLVFTLSDDQKLAVDGVDVVKVARDARGRPDCAAVLAELARRGITRLLIEGGAGVAASFLDRDLVDRLELFTAPMLLGGGGTSAIDALGALSLREVPRFNRISRRDIAADLLESFARPE